MKKLILPALFAASVFALATPAAAVDGCPAGYALRAHRVAPGNMTPTDCALPVCHAVRQTMHYEVTIYTPFYPYNPSEAIWDGVVQGISASGLAACPSYVANGNWH